MHSIPSATDAAAPVSIAPRRCYIICSTARSGSNLLCEDLRKTGVAGNPQEYFLPWFHAGEAPAPSPAVLLRNALVEGTTPNGIFGAKIMWEHFDGIVDRLRGIAGDATTPAPGLLAAVFPDLRYVRTVRRDKIRQAVSLAKAVQSGQWVDYRLQTLHSLTPGQVQEWTRFKLGIDAPIEQIVEFLRANLGPPQANPSPTGPLRYDFEQIAGFHRDILNHEAAWERYFALAGIAPCTVEYEDLAADYHGTICAVLDYLDVPRPSLLSFRFDGADGMWRQSDAVNEEWVARFTADLAASPE